MNNLHIDIFQGLGQGMTENTVISKQCHLCHWQQHAVRKEKNCTKGCWDLRSRWIKAQPWREKSFIRTWCPIVLLFSNSFVWCVPQPRQMSHNNVPRVLFWQFELIINHNKREVDIGELLWRNMVWNLICRCLFVIDVFCFCSYYFCCFSLQTERSQNIFNKCDD